VVVESNRNLDESLKKFALRLGRSAPDIRQDFVSFKELGGIKEFDTAQQAIGMHGTSVAYGRAVRLRWLCRDRGRRLTVPN